MKATSWALAALIGLATIMTQHGEVETAVEIASYALNHPASDFKSKGEAKQLLSELEMQLSAQAFAAACERAKTRDIDYYLDMLRQI